jgi:preprotein translocase subunit SecA
MLGKIARKIFGSANARFVKKQYKIVQQIKEVEPRKSTRSDDNHVPKSGKPSAA